MSSDSSSSDSDCGEELSGLAFRFNYGSSESARETSLLPASNVRVASASTSRSKGKDRFPLSSALDPGIELPKSYLTVYPDLNPSEVKEKMRSLSVSNHAKELLKKSIICQPGFEKLPSVPPYIESKRKLKRERLKERDKTKGPAWFNLPATAMTEEVKNDLTVLQMRNALDPKRFYKRSAFKTLPKYFQIGTVVEHPIDFYHARIPKRQRKQTLVEELLADAEFRKYQKRKYAEALKNQPQKVYLSRRRKKKKERKEKLHEGRSKSRKAKQ